MPFSRGSSRTRNQTQVSCFAVGFFPLWATRKAQISCCFISLNLHIVVLQVEKPRITESNWVHELMYPMSHSQEVGEQKLKWRARCLGLEGEIGIRSTVESRKHWDRKNAACCHLYIESETYNSLVTSRKKLTHRYREQALVVTTGEGRGNRNRGVSEANR